MVNHAVSVSLVQRASGVRLLLVGGAISLACSAHSPSASSVAAGGGPTAVESGGGGAGIADSGASGGAAALTFVTFHKDVEPILQRSCQSCHVAGGIAPFPLLTFEQAHAFGA